MGYKCDGISAERNHRGCLVEFGLLPTSPPPLPLSPPEPPTPSSYFCFPSFPSVEYLLTPFTPMHVRDSLSVIGMTHMAHKNARWSVNEAGIRQENGRPPHHTCFKLPLSVSQCPCSNCGHRGHTQFEPRTCTRSPQKRVLV